MIIKRIMIKLHQPHPSDPPIAVCQGEISVLEAGVVLVMSVHSGGARNIVTNSSLNCRIVRFVWTEFYNRAAVDLWS